MDGCPRGDCRIQIEMWPLVGIIWCRVKLLEGFVTLNFDCSIEIQRTTFPLDANAPGAFAGCDLFNGPRHQTRLVGDFLSRSQVETELRNLVRDGGSFIHKSNLAQCQMAWLRQSRK